ncbi:MAG TPA: oxidoreductase [Deltaproteobacteria bacterium]|nr:oxidoreductase [Deltaproteobacteria bacterium]
MGSSRRARSAEPSSPYTPHRGRIERVEAVTAREKFFRISPVAQTPPPHRPGQFFMVSLPGYGEAPFSICSPPEPSGAFELCIRAVGNLTRALHRLEAGDIIGYRGPYGRGFPVEELRGRHVLFIAGGIGLVPMRPLIKAVTARRERYGRLILLYGIKGPDELLFRDELDRWREAGVEVEVTVDRPHPRWKGKTGVVTTLLPPLELDGASTTAVVIGPPVMYKYVILGLGDKKISGQDIFVSLERRMKCGVGKCGHCQINSVYCCREGPVFRLSEIRHLREAI